MPEANRVEMKPGLGRSMDRITWNSKDARLSGARLIFLDDHVSILRSLEVFWVA